MISKPPGGERDPISRYFSARSAYDPTFSPDGQRVVFLSDITGVPQVWQVRLCPGVEEPLWPDQLTFGAERVMGVWSSPVPDGGLIFSRDQRGNEKQQLYLLPAEDGVEIPLTAGHEGSVHHFGAWSSDGREILFAANRRDRGLFDLYVQPLEGSARLVWQNDEPGYLANLSLAPGGNQAIITRVHSSFRHDLIEVDLAPGTARSIAPTGEDTRYEAVSYSADGHSLYLNTDLGSDFLNIVRLSLDDLSTEQVVSLDGDTETMTPSPDGRYLAFAANVDGASELNLLDLDTGKRQAAPEIPGGAPGVVGAADGRLACAPDSRRIAFSYTSATRTHDIFLWDLESGAMRALTRSSQGGIPDGAFVSPELVSYPTFDEAVPGKVREIPAWFYKPRERGERIPVVVYVHGGPASQFRPQFFPLLQYFVRRGYAVLAPNVRGSTGYGKAYAGLDDVERRMDSVADLAYAARWLKEQPDVDGERLVIYGRSYGGFMVLSAISTYPDLWAAAVDVVGIGNWVTFLENTSGYRRVHREVEYGSLEADREFLASISPIHQVDRIRAPLMVIHGANDPRVPVGEARQLAAALANRGVPVELLVFDDEGHTLSKIKNKLVAYGAIVDFLGRQL